MSRENLVSRVTTTSLHIWPKILYDFFFLARRRIPVKELNPISPITQYLREVSQYATAKSSDERRKADQSVIPVLAV